MTTASINQLAQKDRPVYLPAGLSLLLSLMHIYFFQASPVFNIPIIDSLEYVNRADYILNPAMKPQAFLHSPFYSWFLAGFFFYFGKSFTAIKVLQGILSAISCILLYQLGKRVLSASAGWYAAWLFAFYAPIIFFATEIINVPFILFFTLFSLLLLVRAIEEGNWKWWFAAGLFSGLNIATRADTLLFYLCLSGILIAHKRRHFGKVSVFTLLLLVPIISVGTYNLSVTGRFQALPANSGIVFFQGNNPDYIHTIGIRPGESYQSMIERPIAEGVVPNPDDPANSRYFFKKAVSYIVQHPVDYAQCLFYKIRTLIGGYELPETYDLYLNRSYSPVLRMLLFYKAGFGFPFSLLFPLSVMGMAVMYRKNNSQWLLVLFLAVMMVSLLGYWNSTRYRMSIIPILMLYAGAFLTWLLQQIQAKQGSSIRRSLLLTGVLLAASSAPYPHFSKGYDFKAENYISGGLSLKSAGKLDQGIELLQQGVMQQPDNFYYRGQLARAYQEKGLLQKAMKEYRTALQLNKADVTLHNNIAILYDKIGDEESAVRHYRLALGLNPNYGVTRHNLGALLFKQERYDEAAENLSVAIRFQPNCAISHYLLGMSLLKIGQKEEAIREIAEAVRLDPDRRFYGK